MTLPKPKKDVFKTNKVSLDIELYQLLNSQSKMPSTTIHSALKQKINFSGAKYKYIHLSHGSGLDGFSSKKSLSINESDKR